ncbi:MAG: four helix bundle protein [Bacteroidota bacterium]
MLQFAVDVILYLRTVKNTLEIMDIKRQLIKAVTSTGANYEEVQGAITIPDKKSKMSISLKEIRESHFFLKVFLRLKQGDTGKCQQLVKEGSELKRILASILNKLSTLLLLFIPSL